MSRLGSLVLLTSVVLLLAGCSSPTASLTGPADAGDISTAEVKGGSGGGGGTVDNAPPSVVSFTADRSSGDNGGAFVVVFTGAVSDPNAERDISTLALAATGGTPFQAPTYSIKNNDLKKDEPSEFDASGFKVWDETQNDGVLQLRYRHAVPAFAGAGDVAFTLTVTDDDGASATSSPVEVTITKFSLITVGAPVDANGVPGASWGAWAATPGATNVVATNYLKLVNDGDASNVRVVVDFTEPGFAGAEDPTFKVPINGNVQFAWWEDTTPATTSPTEKAFDFGGASPEGSVTVTFTGPGNVIYIGYRIAQLPGVLPQQAYNAAFTVTEL